MKQWLETREVLDRLAQLARAGGRAALATVVRVRGSAYRHEGAKLLVAQDGGTTGNVSGGCLEQDVREVALQVLRTGRPELRSYCSGADEVAAWDLGVGCEVAVEVGFRVVVVDRRPGYLTVERFPTAARLVESDGAELLERLALDAASYAVVMTHNFADDQAYLRALLDTPAAYIGMLGPRQRTERIVRNVRNLGAAGPDEARIFGPVGLDIGTDGAEQVALAVIAEVLAVRSGRRADSLRERPTPIHAPPD